MRILPKDLFPEPVGGLLRSLSGVGFFDRSTLIGSWVMLIYRELYGVHYTLRTLDLDFAVQVAHGRARMRADLETLISGLGFTSFFAAGGLQKFTGGGYEVEFFVHRHGGRSEELRTLGEWKLSALPLPFLRMLIEFSEAVALDETATLRYPIPEAYFLHKLIINPNRLVKEMREMDLEQCAALTGVLDLEKLRRVLDSQRMSGKTRRAIVTSCHAIGFPREAFGTEFSWMGH